MYLIDTHCHLNFQAFESDFLEVAKRSYENGVEKIIIVGSDPQTSERAIEIAREINNACPKRVERVIVPAHRLVPRSFSEVESLGEGGSDPGERSNLFAYVAVGIHAVHTDRIDFDKIIELANDPLVKAIGETGIDFYHDKERKTENEQITLFRQHIELALALNKPLIIHNREADERVREIIEEYPGLTKAVMHCFSTDHNMAAWAVERGFYLSFTGNITYGNKKIKKAIERTQIERIMVETDAPYNIPEPLRSEGAERCEPYMVEEVIKKIALIKDLNFEEASEQIFQNSIKFFGL